VVTSGKAKYDATKKAIVSAGRGLAGVVDVGDCVCLLRLSSRTCVPAEPTDGLKPEGAVSCVAVVQGASHSMQRT
jgi:hypothetical protein